MRRRPSILLRVIVGVRTTSVTKRGAFAASQAQSTADRFNCKNVPENDGLVMQLVASRKDERERIVSRDCPKLPEEFSFMGELSLVSAAELDPSARVMPEPSHGRSGYRSNGYGLELQAAEARVRQRRGISLDRTENNR
jgi:hypothetical protein